MEKSWLTTFLINSLVNESDQELPFVDSMILEDGTVIACEEFTHNLIHYDISGREIKRLNGIPVPENMKPTLKKVIKDRRIVQPLAQGKLLWMNALSNLSVVDTKTFKATEVNNFWTYCGQKCASIFATATTDFKRFAGIGLSPEGTETLHVYDIAGGTGFASASINKLFKGKLDVTSYEQVDFY